MASVGALAAENPAQTFEHVILPVLDEVCFDCHEPGLSKGDVPFFEAEQVADIQGMRSVWRSVASQLRNRTMPPADKKQPTDEDRIKVVEWIEGHLQDSACELGPFAGYVTARRMNRLEYDRTIHDLMGVDLQFSETLPAEGGTGEGFDNSGESLFLPPMLMERYLEAARQIVDAAIVSPPRKQTIVGSDLMPPAKGEPRKYRPIRAGEKVAAMMSVFVEDDYRIGVRAIVGKGKKSVLQLSVDGVPATRIEFSASGDGKPVEKKLELRLARGVHAIELKLAKDSDGLSIGEVRLAQNFDLEKVSEEQRTNHQRLVGAVVGEQPEDPRKLARDCLTAFLRRAFRRPVGDGEVERFLQLFDRSIGRGDPYEEAMKLTFRGVLISPDFLYRMEREPESEEIQPITDHELASRLSYFLHATMPDEELSRLADEGRLNDAAVLKEQVKRLLDSEESRVFVRHFIGQWLGTKDLGGRVAPITNAVQDFYTPEVASDMREEVVYFFDHLIRDNRSVLEMVDSDDSFLTRRLGKFYQLPESALEKLRDNEFRRVGLREQGRGGVLGMGAVLTMTSHYKQTSPVLRGAWVFDRLIGSPVPPPPPDVPELPTKGRDGKKKLTDREKLDLHRTAASCQACHQLIDPIGFGLQNFDAFGRWRDKDNDQPIDAKGVMPSGESFDGPIEMKSVLAETRRDELVRNLTRKLLGYALGRSLEDRDDCTIAQLVGTLEESDYKARTLIEGIVLSTPFRNRQAIPPEPIEP